MGYAETPLTQQATRRILGPCSESITALGAAFMSRRLEARRRRTLATLTREQLDDVGLAQAPSPVQVVKAGLITNLISMR